MNHKIDRNEDSDIESTHTLGELLKELDRLNEEQKIAIKYTKYTPLNDFEKGFLYGFASGMLFIALMFGIIIFL